MILINITYTSPLSEIDKYLDEHRTYLKEGYEKKVLVSSGPKRPRIGGIIMGKFRTIEEAKEFMQQDPFVVNGLIEMDFIEYEEVMSAK